MKLDWLSKSDFSAGRILFCGVLGGLLAVLHDAVDGGLDSSWYLAIPQHLLMGAGAAFVAIYVLLGTNTQEVLRSCGVALIAGYSWSPVFEAGKEYVLSQPERAAEAAVSADTEELSRRRATLEGGASDANLVKRTGQLAESLAEQVAYLRPGPVKTRALAELGRSVEKIGAKAAKDDADAFDSLANVGEIAARSGNQRLSERAWTGISRIPVTKDSTVDARKKEYRLRFPPPR